jgi:hypothetical protein
MYLCHETVAFPSSTNNAKPVAISQRQPDGWTFKTGLPCGEPDTIGIYPEGSLHRLVSDRLDEFGPTLRAASEGEEKDPDEGSS